MLDVFTVLMVVLVSWLYVLVKPSKLLSLNIYNLLHANHISMSLFKKRMKTRYRKNELWNWKGFIKPFI